MKEINQPNLTKQVKELKTLQRFENSALHAAAYEGYLNLVELLLHDTIDPNSRISNGQTPLHLAAEKGHVQICELLLEKGADPDILDNFDADPLKLAADDDPNHPKLVDIIDLFLKNGFDINKQIDGATLLYRVVIRNNVPAVKFLLEKGIDVNISNETAGHVLQYAMDHNILINDTFLLLLGAGAEIDMRDSQLLEVFVDHMGLIFNTQGTLGEKLSAWLSLFNTFDKVDAASPQKEQIMQNLSIQWENLNSYLSEISQKKDNLNITDLKIVTKVIQELASVAHKKNTEEAQDIFPEQVEKFIEQAQKIQKEYQQYKTKLIIDHIISDDRSEFADKVMLLMEFDEKIVGTRVFAEKDLLSAFLDNYFDSEIDDMINSNIGSNKDEDPPYEAAAVGGIGDDNW